MSHQQTPEPPADYRCPTCTTNDPDWYLNCNHPACPDGRDQARNASLRREEWPELRSVEMREREEQGRGLRTALFIVIVVLLLIIALDR